jgi:hypothetical protein
LYGAFVWARRARKHQKRRFSARAVKAEGFEFRTDLPRSAAGWDELAAAAKLKAGHRNRWQALVELVLEPRPTAPEPEQQPQPQPQPEPEPEPQSEPRRRRGGRSRSQRGRGNQRSEPEPAQPALGWRPSPDGAGGNREQSLFVCELSAMHDPAERPACTGLEAAMEFLDRLGLAQYYTLICEEHELDLDALKMVLAHRGRCGCTPTAPPVALFHRQPSLSLFCRAADHCRGTSAGDGAAARSGLYHFCHNSSKVSAGRR